jgi:hypothetical protein
MFFYSLKCGKRANNFKYLGHIIDNKLNDELDMKSKERMLYGVHLLDNIIIWSCLIIGYKLEIY